MHAIHYPNERHLKVTIELLNFVEQYLHLYGLRVGRPVKRDV